MKEKFSDETIESYLLHRMTLQERQAFEEEIEANPELAGKVRQGEYEHQLMEVLLEDDLLAKMKMWRSENTGPEVSLKRIPFSRRRTAIAIAAVLLVLLAVLIWLNRNEKTKPPAGGGQQEKVEQPVAEENQEGLKEKEPVAEKYPDDNTPVLSDGSKRKAYIALVSDFAEKITYIEGTRSGGGDTEKAFNAALADLGEKRFARGISYLRTIQEKDSTFWRDARYYLGLAYFQQGKSQTALPFLKMVAGDSTYLYSEKAAWFLTLTYLQNGQVLQVEKLLNEMTRDEGHAYQQKAKMLLEQLEKLN